MLPSAMARLPPAASVYPRYNTSQRQVPCNRQFISCPRLLDNGFEYLQHLQDRHMVDLRTTDCLYFRCPFAPCYVKHPNWEQLCEHMRHHLGIGIPPRMAAPYLSSNAAPHRPSGFPLTRPGMYPARTAPQQDLRRAVPTGIDRYLNVSVALRTGEPLRVQHFLQRTYGFPLPQEQPFGHVDVGGQYEDSLADDTPPRDACAGQDQLGGHQPPSRMQVIMDPPPAVYALSESVELSYCSSSAPPACAADPPSALRLRLDFRDSPGFEKLPTLDDIPFLKSF